MSQKDSRYGTATQRQTWGSMVSSRRPQFTSIVAVQQHINHGDGGWFAVRKAQIGRAMAQENIQIRFRQTSHPAARRKTTSHLLTPSCILYQLSSCKVSDRTCRRKRAATIACAACGNHEPLFFEPACICSATLRFVPSFAPPVCSYAPQTNSIPSHPKINPPPAAFYRLVCSPSSVLAFSRGRLETTPRSPSLAGWARTLMD